MKHKQQTFAEELAKSEGRIKAGDLLEEITPLLDECFMGQITCDNGGITYRMLNG